MKSSSWHSRVPTRQRILGGLRGGLPSPPAPGHRCGLVAMSRICGACNKPCGTAHDCISCGKPVHSTVLCESVWMPGEESEEEGEGSDKPDPVAWSMPDGFTLGAEPSKLDASLVGKHIYMRWKDYGCGSWARSTSRSPTPTRASSRSTTTASSGPTPPRARRACAWRTTRTARTRLSTRGWCWSARREAPAERSRGGRQRARAEGSKLADDWG